MRPREKAPLNLPPRDLEVPRAKPLPLGPYPQAGRKLLSAMQGEVISTLFDAINEHRRLGDEAREAGDLESAISAYKAVGQLSARIAEMTIGKKVTMDVNMRHQEDVFDWNLLPPEIREAAEKVLDYRANQPTVIEGEVVERRPLPARREG